MIRSALASMIVLVSITEMPVIAEEETEATLHAYAAGYKAAFTCSALFNGSKSLQQVKAHELTGVYREIQPILDALPDAKINYDEKSVSVKYSDTMPPRISANRGELGCIQLPPGAQETAIKALPNFTAHYADRSPNLPWTSTKTGVEKNSLKALLINAFSNKNYGKNALTSALLVATPDTLLAEKYIEGFDHQTSQRTWSVAKSIAATIIGMAIQDKVLDLTVPAGLPEWQHSIDPRKKITLENLLHMASGLDSNRAETDWEGNFILSSQVWTTSRDLARLGILYLQDGIWDGKRILPEGWVKYVSSPLGPQPPEKRTNGTAIPGYGAQFWLFNERFPNIPNDTFAAMGNRGQFLVIIPSRNLVIIRRGYDPAGGEGFKIDKFVEDVLTALAS